VSKIYICGAPLNGGDPTGGKMKELDTQSILGVYAKPDTHFVRGSGCWLEDVTGRRYLDFYSGIAVMALGHSDPEVVKAIHEQTERYTHISNLFINEPQVKLAQQLLQATGFDKVFFCNSGTEANEAQIKFARKYWAVKGEARSEIISFSSSFHGRTYGGLSVTGQPKLKNGFGEMLTHCKTVPWNDPKALLAAVGKKTAAILLEPVQGEGGINPASPEFVDAVHEARRRTGALVMVDDIQCGLGRLGTFLGAEAVGLSPDLLSLAKPLGGGLPLGAVLLREAVAETMKPGDHGSTFGGNPVACAAGSVVVRRILSDKFLEEVKRKGELIRSGLRFLSEKYPVLGEVRGMGLLNGVEVVGKEVAPLLHSLRNNGLLAIRAGTSVLRLAPPLVVSDEEISLALQIIDRTIAEAK
jgi:predicted acetylornithine/succinylornithine family transaminase